MRRPRIIPCLLLSDGNLVKTHRFKHPAYLGDPINAVHIFNDKCVDELCLQDIQASRLGREIDFELLQNIASEAFMPMCYGGGIRTIQQAERLFQIGFEKVILNTAFAENPQLVTDIAKRFGSQSVIVSIDAKQDALGRQYVAIKGGSVIVREAPKQMALRAQEMGAGEVLLNCVQRDGTMQGYDLKLVKEVAAVLDIPLVACGGAGSVRDLANVLHEANAHAAAAGSLFVYYGPRKAVLIHVPEEKELWTEGVYRNE